MKSLLSFVILTAATAHALTTQYLSFQEPEGWKCERAQRIYICQSTAEADKRESLVMSIAMIATEWDSLQNYESYLKQTKTIADEKGNPVPSKVTYVRRRNINGYMWVDSLQLNSELPGFYTRYLATVHNQLAILMSYVVSEERYQALAPVYERMISSLRPNKDFNLATAQQGDVPIATPDAMAKQKDILADKLNKKKVPVAEVAEEAPPGLPVAKIAIAIALLVMAVVIIKRSGRPKS